MTKKQNRDAAIDGIRAIAALAVVAYHAGVPVASAGHLGVQVFFVLSGYLITRNLRERMATRSLDIATFMRGRARRLAPALLAMLLICTLLAWVLLPGEGINATIWAMLSVLYLSDLAGMFGATSNFYGHTWSLAVEVQFYLIWPFVVRALPRTDRLEAVTAGLALVSVALYALTGLNTAAGYCNPAPLIVGAGLTFVRLPRLASLQRALSWPPLVTIGLLSYGIYLWHFPLLHFLPAMAWPATFAVALALSTALAALSYLTIERWAGCAKTPLWPRKAATAGQTEAAA